MVNERDAVDYISGSNLLRLSCLTLSFVIAAAVSVSGAEIDVSRRSLTELPLERLLDVPVVSASRKNQTLSGVSSAVFVINQDDIRHSGATTIPDLLRMVPGVQVASIDGNTWAISIRGFNGTFANKLLVMIDGRSVYTPLYGGVFWDVQDTLLENIDRIEVIRGSGGTMWGANAVNGVIHIITKSSQDTQNRLLSGLIGSREKGTVGASLGAAISDSTSYRLYVKHLDRGNTHSTSGSADDSLIVTRGGFRMDSTPSNTMQITLQGDLYGGTAKKTATIPTFSLPFTRNISQPADLFGGNILSRLDWLQSESSKFSLQFYYDRTGRDTTIVNEDRDTVDIDLQHNLRLFKMHELTWGAGYRFIHDTTPGTINVFSLTPTSRSDNLLNLFVQDEISLVPETLRFTIGTKLEHNDYTGWEIQPSARVTWIPLKGYTAWAAVSRSVRTPTRGEQDATIGLMVIPPTPPVPLPSVIALKGSRELKSESLLSYEAGFRADLTETFALDISSFYNRYHDIIGSKQGTSFVEGGTQLTIPFYFSNLNNYDSCGGEISLQWQTREWWKLKGGYAYIRFFGDALNQNLATKSTPGHQATLRSMMVFGRNVDLDLWARYVGANTFPLFNGGSTDIPGYFTMDARLAWRPMAGVELSIVGQNLLEDRHLEAVSDQTVLKHEIERSVYGKIAWAF